MSPFDFASLLLLLGFLLGVVNDRTLKLPRPVALLLGSLVASALIIGAGDFFGAEGLRARLHDRVLGSEWPHALLDGVLALLLFAGSLHADLRGLARRIFAVFVLATIGVVIAAGLFGAGLWAALQWIGAPVPLAWCLVVGAILAPTDAVAVEGLLAQVSLPPGLAAVISGESLFNDGVAVVLVGAALAVATGRTDVVGPGKLATDMLIESGGGALLGAAAGYVGFRLLRFGRDPGLALMFSLALVLATYRGAAALHFSGPIAVVSAGLMLKFKIDALAEPEPEQKSVAQFWAQADELTNAMLYLLIGFTVLAIDFNRTAVLAVLLAVPLALLVRIVSVGPPMLLLDLRFANAARATGVLTWAGLRGGISIALALVLPETPYRNLLLTICFGVVIFTVAVQGLTLRRVIGALYGPPADKA